MSLLYQFFLIFFFISYSYSQDSTHIAKKEKRLKVAGLALPGIDPEYGFYVQGGLVGLFKTVKDSSIRTSNIYLFGLYSQYNQWRFSTGGDIFTKNESFYINSWYYMSHLPDLFFGISNQSNPKDFEFVDYYINYANTNIYRRLDGKLFLGIGQFYERVYSIDYTRSKLFQKEVEKRWIGEGGYEAYGFGPRLRFDNRDNVYSTQTGRMLELGFYQYYITGNVKSNHQRIFIDARTFHSMDKDRKHVLAFQLFAEEVNIREVPFALMPGLNIRAYHPNLFKGKAVSSFQSEYRARVWKSLGFSLFGGIGNVSDNLFEVENNSLKPNYGVGIRCRVVKKDNLNVRLEYGMGDKSSNIYLSFYDAF